MPTQIAKNPLTFVEIFTLLCKRDGFTPGDSISGEDLDKYNISILGGCSTCAASLAAYNGYPCKDGYWKCETCIHSKDDWGVYSLDDWMKLTEAPEADFEKTMIVRNYGWNQAHQGIFDFTAHNMATEKLLPSSSNRQRTIRHGWQQILTGLYNLMQGLTNSRDGELPISATTEFAAIIDSLGELTSHERGGLDGGKICKALAKLRFYANFETDSNSVIKLPVVRCPACKEQVEIPAETMPEDMLDCGHCHHEWLAAETNEPIHPDDLKCKECGKQTSHKMDCSIGRAQRSSKEG